MIKPSHWRTGLLHAHLKMPTFYNVKIVTRFALGDDHFALRNRTLFESSLKRGE
jgi:hypothetical protein